jgi:Ner family transcriptional regulator
MVVCAESSPSMSRQDRQLFGWHPEDVKAAIRKKGVTLTELALRHGYSECYLRNALIRPLYEGEQIIARFLKMKAQEIWPDRYDADGTPNYAKFRQLQRERAQRTRRAA